VHMYYLGEASLPSAGTYNLSVHVDAAGGGVFHMIELNGVANAAPEATVGNDDGDTGAESIATNITTSTANAWVVDVIGSGANINFATNQTGQTEIGDLQSASNTAAVSYLVAATTGSKTMGWTASGSNRLSHALAAFAPASGSGTCIGGGTGTCNDGIQNQDESDVDCGGICGANCTQGEMCGDGGDCASGYCENPGSGLVCSGCSDGRQNQNETGVDCGGVCPACGGGCVDDQGIRLLYRDGNNGDGQTQEMRPHFNLYNDRATSINLDNFEVRYWFTNEPSDTLEFACDYAQQGCDKISAVAFSAAGPLTGVDTVMSVTFTGSVDIGAGANTGQWQVRFHDEGYNGPNFNEDDDYSYIENAQWVQNMNYAVYENGSLVWGCEP